MKSCFVLAGTILLLLLMACNRSQPVILLRFNPGENKIYEGFLTIEGKTQLYKKGKENFSMDLDLEFELEQKAERINDSLFHLRVVYKSFSIRQILPGQKIEYDSKQNGEEDNSLIDSLIQMIIDKSFYLTINDRGKIISADLDSLDITGEMQIADPSMIADRFFIYYPADSITIGSTWTVDTRPDPMFPVLVRYNYTVDRITSKR